MGAFLYCRYPNLTGERFQKNLKYFRDIAELPINPESFDFKDKIGSGGECNAYLLESREPEKRESVVLKVSHFKQGDPRSLAAQAADYRTEFERVKNIYKDIPDVVPGEAWLVARNVRKFFG